MAASFALTRYEGQGAAFALTCYGGQGGRFALFLVPPFGVTGSNPPLVICCLIKGGGERGIRTPDTAFGPYNDLANRRLQPLGHLSAYGIGACGSPKKGENYAPHSYYGPPETSKSIVKWRALEDSNHRPSDS